MRRLFRLRPVVAITPKAAPCSVATARRYSSPIAIPPWTFLMNWQTPIALAVVVLTAAAFAWKRLRPRRVTFTKDSPCGCGTSRSTRPEGIVISGRRGETPRITFKP